MKEIAYNMVGSLVMFYANIYVWSKLLNKQINYKNMKFYITWFSLSIISIINTYLFNKFIKLTILTIVYMFFVRFLFKENEKKSILTPLFSQMLVMISEGFCLLILATIFKLDLNGLKDQYLGTIFINVFISIVYMCMSKIKIVNKIYNLLLSSIKRISKKFLIVLSMIVLIIANVLAMTTYYEVDVRILILINISFTLICVIIVFYSFRVQNNYIKVSNKYNVAINSLRDYENMMQEQKILNHENKNMLLTIRAMIKNKEKNIPKYIDSIVEEKYSDNENLLKKVNIIPSGGLRATIYSEILKIQNNKISYNLNIDSKLKTVDMIEIDTDTIIEICKIIGVFIDNAIEEVKKLKDKNIEIDLFIQDNCLNIKVSNNYKGIIEVDKIYNEGYTTKGQGHGYGLSLVKKIIDNNNIFENKVEISDKIFSQILIIDYKNNI